MPRSDSVRVVRPSEQRVVDLTARVYDLLRYIARSRSTPRRLPAYNNLPVSVQAAVAGYALNLDANLVRMVEAVEARLQEETTQNDQPEADKS